MNRPNPEHWLVRYANDYHKWSTTTTTHGQQAFTRPLGLVEFSFDTDGTEYGGRADLHSILTLEINHTLSSKADFRQRIALAWANLRLQHPIMMSRTAEDSNTGRRSFVVDVSSSAEEAYRKAAEAIVWIEDYHEQVVDEQLFEHALNVGRIIEPEKCLSKLHILPLIKLSNGNFKLRLLIVLAHQISDGLSAYTWFNHLIRLLNLSSTTLWHELALYRQPSHIQARLPPAQEDLYPRIPGNRARQRWFWAIIRVLRHVRKTLPPTFLNPLRREKRLSLPSPLQPLFPQIFSYAHEARPPLTTGTITALLSPKASARMMFLCRSANVSIGAGCFALAGLAMMALHEQRYPDGECLPFAAGFPLNPRPFLTTPTSPDSCMLTFSDGVVMNFLPSHLPIEGRFRLTARRANRELRMYQKRGRGGALDGHSPGRLLANAYLFQTERVESKLPKRRKSGVNPQGELPAKPGRATFAVSSVGSTAGFFRPGMFSLDLDLPSSSSYGGVAAGEGVRPRARDFAADFRGLRSAVRAREDEFLVGSSTDAGGIVRFGVSYDENYIDGDQAEKWAECIRGLLEEKRGGGVGVKL